MDVFHALDPIQLRRHAGKHVAKVAKTFGDLLGCPETHKSLLILWTFRNAKDLSQPEALVLKLRYLKGLKARHIDSRWRKPPEPCEKKYLRPEGPTQQPVCRPFRPQFVDDSDPVARTTGIGCIGPPGLICATSKLTLRVRKKSNKPSRVSVHLQITEALDEFRYPQI